MSVFIHRYRNGEVGYRAQYYSGLKKRRVSKLFKTKEDAGLWISQRECETISGAHFVYMITCRSIPRKIKIGYTNDLNRRLNDLSSENGEVTLVGYSSHATKQEAFDTEQFWHQKFRSKSTVKYEWHKQLPSTIRTFLTSKGVSICL